MFVLLLAAMSISVLSALFLWRRVHAPGTTAAGVLLLACAEWTAASALEMLSPDLAGKILWNNMQYLGIASVPTVFFTFSIRYTGRGKWLSHRNTALLVVMPLLTVLAVMTNGSTGFFWISRQIETIGGSEFLVNTFGTGFWIHASYSYLLLGSASLMLLQMLMHSRRFYGWQTTALLTALFVPWVANAVTIFRISPIPWIDLTPLGFTAAGLSIAAALSGLRKGDITSVTQKAVMENLHDGVLVLDSDGRIVDLNPAAREILGLAGDRAQGKLIREVWPEWREAVDEEVRSSERGQDISLVREGRERTYHVRESRLVDWRGVLVSLVVVLHDISDRKMAEQALRDSEARYRDLFENASDAVYTIDMLGNFTSANRAALRLTGHTEEEIRSLNIMEILPEEQRDRARDLIERRLANPSATKFELDIESKDGRPIVVEVNSRVMHLGGRPVGVQAIARDVTETRAMTERLRQSVADLEAIHDAALSLNSANNLEEVTRTTLTGARRLAAADKLRLLVLDDGEEDVVIRAQLDEDGRFALDTVRSSPCLLTRSIMQEARVRYVANVAAEGAPLSRSMGSSVQAYAGIPLRTRERAVGIMYVTYDRPHALPAETQQVLQIIASHAAIAIRNVQMFEATKSAALTDALTGLSNHRHLMDQLDYEMDRAQRSGHPLTVMMMDVDGFKLVNDTHGHVVGDDLLRLVSRTIKDALRGTDIVGRYGGDEFLALLPETDRPGAERAAERVMRAIRAIQFKVPGRENDAPDVVVPVRVSIGTAIYPLDSGTRMELISLADSAMYASKRGGGNIATLAHATDSAFLVAQNTTFGVLDGLLNTVDAKDHYTRLHSELVAQHALALADALGLSAEARRSLRIAGLLHDVGKIGIPDRILRKPGPLNEEEAEAIRQHPLLGEMIIREVPQLTEILEAVKHHHERYDGGGYPRGAHGEEIPFMARIIAIADAYSAMTVDRPYRRALTAQEALAELRKGSGTQFDPEMVEPFIRALQLEPRETRAS